MLKNGGFYTCNYLTLSQMYLKEYIKPDSINLERLKVYNPGQKLVADNNDIPENIISDESANKNKSTTITIDLDKQ